ncbi:MAG: glycosyltransferase family 4 protein [Endomicrobium sp.]|jgi:glycosyltransferase involved in cell wall biosynthesis|nr:glycosyltransferase family 4 protein [Endomicrobium sp.]
MKVLFITSHLPYPPHSGGRLREFKLLEKFKGKCDVFLCVVTKTFDEDIKNSKYIKPLCTELKLFKAYASNLDENNYPQQIIRNFCLKAQDYINSMILNKKIDVIHLEGYYMLSNIQNDITVPILLVEQNIEYSILKQKLSLLKDALLLKKHKKEYKLNLKHERGAWRRCNMCVTLTSDDCSVINNYDKNINCKIIPNGIDHVLEIENKHLHTSCNAKTNLDKYILYVGNFDYYPNVDAAKYLIEYIFPKIKKIHPKLKLYVVGNNSNIVLDKYKFDDIVITGKVDNLNAYYKTAELCVFPLRIGGGIKVKVLEALTLKQFVVTTSIGAQGIPKVENSQMIVSDKASDIISSVCNVLTMKKDEKSEREKNNNAILSKFITWDTSANRLIDQYKKLLKESVK